MQGWTCAARSTPCSTATISSWAARCARSSRPTPATNGQTTASAWPTAPAPRDRALRALGIGAPARVVTVANAGFYASTAVHAVGARPLYVDVTEDTLTLCPD